MLCHLFETKTANARLVSWTYDMQLIISTKDKTPNSCFTLLTNDIDSVNLRQVWNASMHEELQMPGRRLRHAGLQNRVQVSGWRLQNGWLRNWSHGDGDELKFVLKILTLIQNMPTNCFVIKICCPRQWLDMWLWMAESLFSWTKTQYEYVNVMK